MVVVGGVNGDGGPPTSPTDTSVDPGTEIGTRTAMTGGSSSMHHVYLGSLVMRPGRLGSAQTYICFW